MINRFFIQGGVLMMAALSSGSNRTEELRANRGCTTGPDNLIFRNLDPNGLRGDSARVPVLVSTSEGSPGEQKISFW